MLLFIRRQFDFSPHGPSAFLTLKRLSSFCYIFDSRSEPAAVVGGVDVHAGVAFDGRDKPRLERLCRYLARPLNLPVPGYSWSTLACFLPNSAEEKLENWFKKRHRKRLTVRGARQVGKSTLVRCFAQSQGLSLVELNLEQQAHLNAAFATLDPVHIFREIEASARQKLEEGALLFLDKLQATPAALPALRYLHEARPDLPVIAAGSLLESPSMLMTFRCP